MRRRLTSSGGPRRGARRSSPSIGHAGGGGGGADRTSALPDDLLLLVLARLRCAASVLARRWRGLWKHLTALAFRDVAFGSLEPALAQVSASSPPAPSLLDIHVPDMPLSTAPPSPRCCAPPPPRRSSSTSRWAQSIATRTPSFPRATSIKLDALVLFAHAPPSPSERCFPMLTTLVLSNITVHGLTAMISRCPCLLVLRFTGGPWAKGGDDITMRSSSLRELVVADDDTLAERIDIATPMLEHLTLSFLCQSKLSLCVLAPKVEKVSWCHYIFYTRGRGLGFGLWTLQKVSLTTESAAERRRSSVLLRREPGIHRLEELDSRSDQAGRSGDQWLRRIHARV